MFCCPWLRHLVAVIKVDGDALPIDVLQLDDLAGAGVGDEVEAAGDGEVAALLLQLGPVAAWTPVLVLCQSGAGGPTVEGLPLRGHVNEEEG